MIGGNILRNSPTNVAPSMIVEGEDYGLKTSINDLHNDNISRAISFLSDVLLHFLAWKKHDAMLNQYFFNYGTYIEQ